MMCTSKDAFLVQIVVQQVTFAAAFQNIKNSPHFLETKWRFYDPQHMFVHIFDFLGCTVTALCLCLMG